MILSLRCYGDGASLLCDWVNSCHCAQTTVQLEKLHAIGYKPVLLLGKETKKKKNKCEILTPRCTLSTYAKDYRQKIGSFYKYLCEGWDQDSSGSDAQLITLHLTPCDLFEGQEEQAIVTEGQEEQAIVTEGQEEQAIVTEGEEEQAIVTEGQEEQAIVTEGQEEQAIVTEGQEEQAIVTEGQEEQAIVTEGQEEQAIVTEGQEEQAIVTEGQEEQAIVTEGQEAIVTEGR
ncbi:apolipo B receptor [Labeo rohita]|uniref:Apolipo B receptor n=1 Tax=Labeo rohita TaxID=84645 RepID=A0A498LY21_LABRO|nr:apolipo B receptor [Labeo rohita]